MLQPVFVIIFVQQELYQGAEMGSVIYWYYYLSDSRYDKILSTMQVYSVHCILSAYHSCI